MAVMRLAGSGSADEDHVVRRLDELQGMQPARQGFVDTRLGELEPREIPVRGETATVIL